MNYSGQYEFPVKKFFWCTSANYEFAELPELNQQHEPNADKLATPFFGEPEKILEQLEKGTKYNIYIYIYRKRRRGRRSKQRGRRASKERGRPRLHIRRRGNSDSTQEFYRTRQIGFRSECN